MTLVTLEEWARDTFRTPPSPNTLRKWARAGLIHPAPVKHGRSYYVDSQAQYQEPQRQGRIPLGSSLISRIASARNGTKAA